MIWDAIVIGGSFAGLSAAMHNGMLAAAAGVRAGAAAHRLLMLG